MVTHRSAWFGVTLLILGVKISAANSPPEGEEGSNDLPDDPGLLLIPKYVEKVYNSDPVTLDVPEIWGNSETVAQLVASKKGELAATALHHANVIERQDQEKVRQAEKEQETETTRAKIVDVRVNQLRHQINSTEQEVTKLNDEKSEALLKEEEAKAAVQMSSKKKKAEKKAQLEQEEANIYHLQTQMAKAKNKLKTLGMDVVGATEESDSLHTAEGRIRINSIPMRVKLAAAKDDVLRAKLDRLKATHMKAIATANATKEIAHKQMNSTLLDIATEDKMLKRIDPHLPAAKEVKKQLAESRKKFEDEKKALQKKTEQVDKVQKESADKEKKWLEKHKYHNMLSSYSNTSGMVKKSDKAFKVLLKNADKKASKLMTEELSKVSEKAEQRADDAIKKEEHAEIPAAEVKLMAGRKIDEKLLEEKAVAEEEQREQNEVASQAADAMSEKQGNVVSTDFARAESMAEDAVEDVKEQEAESAGASDDETSDSDSDADEPEQRDSASLSMHWHKVETDSPSEILGLDEP